ncbi:hypothetical protein MRY87_09640 [bacterium]|nr:hypothetical protein [bacterium]
MDSFVWTSFFPKGVGARPPVSHGEVGTLHAGAAVGAGIKVYLHFFPVAKSVSAPYPVQAMLELFEGGCEIAKQSFEGLRINQPDGLDLADVFPQLFAHSASRAESQSVSRAGEESLSDGSGEPPRWVAPPRSGHSMTGRSSGYPDAVGVRVTLSSHQPRIDLCRSKVMVEVCYPSHRLRYHAVSDAASASEAHGGLVGDEPRVVRSVYAHEDFDTQLLEINPASGSGERGVSFHSHDDELPPLSLRGSLLNARSLPGFSGVIREGEFEPVGRLPRGVQARGEGRAAAERVQYLVQYERTTALPVSVRCV